MTIRRALDRAADRTIYAGDTAVIGIALAGLVVARGLIELAKRLDPRKV